MKPVSCSIFDPVNSIFKHKAKEKAECKVVFCEIENCPLRKKEQCMLCGSLFITKCPYGKIDFDVGYTKRAKNYYKWIDDKKEKYKNIPCLTAPNKKMEFIGDYVYLPYAHMTMCESVPFLSHGKGFFSKGICLIHKDNWNINNVLKLVNFKPIAILGGIIETYQKEEIPKFLIHLKEEDPDIWTELIKIKPELNTQTNHVGRKALLKTLNYPITIYIENNKTKYNVEWEWNGEYLITKSPNAYNNTWGKLKVESFELKAIPKDNTEVKIQDNSWVNENTIFTT